MQIRTPFGNWAIPERERRATSLDGIALRSVSSASTRRPFVRILYVNEKCGYFGGVEQNIADSAEGLTARGHECFLAFQEVTGRQMAEFQANFKECVPIHSWQHSVDR